MKVSARNSKEITHNCNKTHKKKKKSRTIVESNNESNNSAENSTLIEHVPKQVDFYQLISFKLELKLFLPMYFKMQFDVFNLLLLPTVHCPFFPRLARHVGITFILTQIHLKIGQKKQKTDFARLKNVMKFL